MKQLILLALLIILYLNDAYALVDGEKYKTKVIGIHPKNIIILPRGLEDAIFKGDHIKLTLPNGFIARGVAIRVEMDKSFWKVYRIVKPEYLNQAFSYDLTAINQSEAPDKYKGLVAGFETPKIHQKKITLFYDRTEKTNAKKLEQNEDYLVDQDIPKDLQNDEAYLESKKTFLEKILDKKKFQRDMRHIDVSLYMAPFLKESRSELTSYHYGATIKNRPKKRYQLEFGHQAYGFSLADPVTNEEANLSRSDTLAKVNYHNMGKNLFYTTELAHYSEKIGTLSVIDSQWRLAPLGVIYQLLSSDEVDFFNIGYLPTIERRSSETYIDGERGEDAIFTLRNSFRIHFKISSKNFELEEDFRFQPAMNGTGDDDRDIRNQIFLRYKPSETFNIEYSNTFVKDGRYQYLAGINPNNMIHSFNFRLNFSL